MDLCAPFKQYKFVRYVILIKNVKKNAFASGPFFCGRIARTTREYCIVIDHEPVCNIRQKLVQWKWIKDRLFNLIQTVKLLDRRQTKLRVININHMI